MAYTVKKAFHHANTGRTWHSGDVFSGPGAAELARRGYLAKAPDAPTAEVPGAPGYGEMTVRELSALCAERGIPVPSKPRKADLIAALGGE